MRWRPEQVSASLRWMDAEWRLAVPPQPPWRHRARVAPESRRRGKGMANTEQLAILGQGTEAWNAWRRNKPPSKIDLRDADLGEADLRRADLGEADLRDANLWDADLRGANLRGADLREAYLLQAKFRWVDLSGANLLRTIFTSGCSCSSQLRLPIGCCPALKSLPRRSRPRRHRRSSRSPTRTVSFRTLPGPAISTAWSRPPLSRRFRGAPDARMPSFPYASQCQDWEANLLRRLS